MGGPQGSGQGIVPAQSSSVEAGPHYNPAYWYDRAAEAITIASTADAEAKAILLRLANDFVRLAERAEARLKQEILRLPQGMPPTR